MRTPLVSLLTATLILAWGNDKALAQDKSTAFEQKANALNQTVRKNGTMDTALREVSVETRLPQDEVQALRRNHPNAGASGILLAAVMADQTRKPAEAFLQSHVNGKSWESIAAENHVSVQTLEQKLNQMQRALNNPRQTAAATTTNPTQPAAITGSIDQKVSALNQSVQTGGNMNAALHAISVETGVPQDQVQTLQQNHAAAGAGGILIASVMADETKQAPETFLQSHSGGKSWETIASDNKVSLEKLDMRLNRLQKALGYSPNAPAPTGR